MFTLSWQPPYDWSWMLGFLAARAVDGVETVGEGFYARSLVVGEHRGLISVSPHLPTHTVQVSVSAGLLPVAPACLAKVSRLFDLDCQPAQANYFALRGWQAKDIFLPDDYLIKQRFAGMTPAQIRRYAERWKPWRSYALLHIWYTHGWQPSMDSEIAGIQ
ncbi:hypothetical protein FMC17_20820 [Salmonella enterica subsp. enterica serovar Enteritidis]|nr:hypothetical protein [Salmonella enterica subsp. enterica serovar Enteritidis]